MNRKLLLLILLCIPCFGIMYAQDTNCDGHDLSTATIYNTLCYDLSKNGTVVPPHADSVWIDTPNDTSVFVISHAQSGDYINISHLERGYYLLHVQIGSCVHTKRFGKREKAVIHEKKISILNTMVGSHKMLFSLFEKGQIGPPHVDSIWIVGCNTHCNAAVARVCLRTQAQSGDTINLESLLDESETTYQCIAWINGSDYWSDSFTYSGECEEYKDVIISFIIINPHRAVVNIARAGQSIPHLDSMWITPYSRSEVLMTAKPQAGDTIDLTPLVGQTDGTYTGWLRFGECIKKTEFEFNGKEYDYCLETGVAWLRVESNENGTTIKYYLMDRDANDIEATTFVDSVWIESNEQPSKYLFSSKAQQGEDIDISSLELNTYYNLYAQVGECQVSTLFKVLRDHTDGFHEAQSYKVQCTKVLRDGQLLIECNGKTYNAQGAEVR